VAPLELPHETFIVPDPQARLGVAVGPVGTEGVLAIKLKLKLQLPEICPVVYEVLFVKDPVLSEQPELKSTTGDKEYPDIGIMLLHTALEPEATGFGEQGDETEPPALVVAVTTKPEDTV
jgi:hypothetical protein